MTVKTILAAALFAAAASTAFAQSTQQPTAPTAPRPAVPAAPATPAQPSVPRAVQQPATTPAATAQPAQPAQRPAANQSQLVNLNTATKDQLDGLPQIGDARAQAIIARRPYKDWSDFVAKSVVPANAEAAIKDKVRFR